MTDRTKKFIRILVVLLPVITLIGTFIALPFCRDWSLLRLTLAALAVLGLVYMVKHRPAYLFGSAAGYCAFYIVMLLYAGVSLLWVKNIGSSLYAYAYQVMGVLVVFAVTAAVTRREMLLRLLDVLTVCYVLVLLLGIFEILTGRYLFSPTNPELLLRNAHGLRFPYACFYNTNDFSSYITLLLPFAAYDLTIRIKGKWGKLSALLLCAAALFTLDNANARACWIAVAVMAVALVAVLLYKHPIKKRLRPLLLSGMGVFVFAGLLIGFRFHAFAKLAGVFTSGHSVRERSMLTGGALRMLADYHWMGVGVGNSVSLIPYYSGSIKPFDLHNMTLQILTEYGIIIFAFYAVFLVSLAIRFFRYSSDKTSDDMLANLCFAVVCAYPFVGIASSDMTHLTALWLVPGILFACMRIMTKPVRAESTSGKKMLLISFIDFGEMASGSSVRPQRMYEAFRKLGFTVSLLSGLQNRKWERHKRVFAKYRELKKEGLPDFCYVEPPSGPFFNLCDHLMLIWLKKRGVPIGLFYRDAYWKFAEWWQVKGLKRLFLILMQKFDLAVIRRTCKIVYFPTQSMANLFDLPRKDILPPAGADFVIPPHKVTRCALYVGGVAQNYGTDILLKAFEIVNEREKKDIRLTLVCRESEQADFFTGYRERPWLTIKHASGDSQLAPIYAQSDIAIYPSKRDFYMDFCMPVKLFEYLSRALPVVCTSCKEAAAFVERNGIGLVTEDNPEALAEKIILLYDTPGLMEEIRLRCVSALQENLWTSRAQKAADQILN